MDIGERFLPVGSVCLLKNGTKKVMVTGFCIKSPDTDDKIYDYIGCLYPEGVISSDQNLLFDHNQIAQLFFKGYVCDEEIQFKKNLNELLSKTQVDSPTSNDIKEPITQPNNNISDNETHTEYLFEEV